MINNPDESFQGVFKSLSITLAARPTEHANLEH